MNNEYARNTLILYPIIINIINANVCEDGWMDELKPLNGSG